jgi:GxxExxY protein
MNRLDEGEFEEMNYQIMGHAFACHRELGRLCDEAVYRNDLAARLSEAGFRALTEQRVQVSFQGFAKDYLLDLVVNESIIYELKAVSALTREHEAQLLNYLFLCGAPTGKLVNFRPASVSHRTVNAIVPWDRQRYAVFDLEHWRPHNRSDQGLPGILQELIGDWGVFLETGLYYDVLVHLFGGEEVVYREIPLTRNGLVLGTQRLPLLSPDTAFRLTALTKETPSMESHLRRLLHLTALNRLHWVNFNHHVLEFRTLLRQGF